MTNMTGAVSSVTTRVAQLSGGDPPQIESNKNVRTDSVGRSLRIFGDQWNQLIIREMFLGARRFQDLKIRLNVSDSVLSQRLRDLVEEDVLLTTRYQAAPPRHEYRLTEAGRDLWRVFVARWMWETRWVTPPPNQRTPRLYHDLCGHSIMPLLSCRNCGVIGITPHDTSARRRDVQTLAQAIPIRQYRKSSARREDDPTAPVESMILLGNRWSITILGAAFLGISRFSDFQAQLVIPPLILSSRLKMLAEHNILQRVAISSAARRQEYRLTPKGLDFFPVLAHLVDWGNCWFPDGEGPALLISHRACGASFSPALTCNACNVQLARRDVRFVQ